jgi:hypothetical protein
VNPTGVLSFLSESTKFNMMRPTLTSLPPKSRRKISFISPESPIFESRAETPIELPKQHSYTLRITDPKAYVTCLQGVCWVRPSDSDEQFLIVADSTFQPQTMGEFQITAVSDARFIIEPGA